MLVESKQITDVMIINISGQYWEYSSQFLKLVTDCLFENDASN